MVQGLEKFREYFSEFDGNYVIIGGTACDVALQGTDMPPRATNDIDMILVVEKMTPDFGRQFWRFIADGNYTSRQRRRGEGKEPAPELFVLLSRKLDSPSKSSCFPNIPMCWESQQGSI